MKIRSNAPVLAIAFLAVLAALILVATPAIAQVTNGDDDAGTAAPVAADSNTESSSGATGSVTNGNDDVDFVAPLSAITGTGSTGTVTNGDDDVGGSAPVVVDTTGSNGTITNGDDDVGTKAPVVSNPNTPAQSSGSGRGIRYSSSPASTLSASSSCPLINSYMKLGWRNDPAEVSKLQAFLKSNQGLDVSVTGIFDQKTDDAVKAFQRKYLSTTMGPWNATRPSGFVYITTAKVINQIACAQPLTLSADEVAIIEEYISRTPNSVGGSDDSTSASTSNEIGGIEIPISLANVDTEKANGNDLEAVASNASLAARFWGFLVGMFNFMFR